MKMFKGRGKLSSYMLAAAVTFIWSITFVATKYLLGYLSPGEILLYRVAVAYVIFVAAAGFLGITLYFLCENTALSFSTASNVALLCSTAPLLTGVVSHIFTSSEKMSRRFVLGSVFCLIGIFFIIFNGRFVLKLNPLGDMIALLAALTFAGYSVVIRDVKCDYTPAQIARKMLFYTLISLLLLTLTPVVRLHPSQLMRPAVAGNILFLGLFASAFCTWGWNIVIWSLGAVKANNLIYLTPPVTMLFSALILDERITLFAVAGGLLILAGVYISQKIH